VTTSSSAPSIDGSPPDGSTTDSRVGGVFSTSFRERWAAPVLGAGLTWFAARLFITLIAVIAHLRSDGAQFFSRPGWFADLFFHWDSVYFAGIARAGYFADGTASTWVAFFPGYPVLSGGVARLVPGDATEADIRLALCLVAGIAAAASGIALWRLVEDRYGRRITRATVVLYFFGPYSVFLVASYSESLYLAFAISAWLWVSRGRWATGAVIAALAGFTRINGVFLVLALAVLLILVLRQRGVAIVPRVIGFVAIAMSGVGAYMIYLWARTGDILAWSHAQTEGWHRVTTWPWSTLHSTIVAAGSEPAADVRFQLVMDLIFAILCCIGLIALVLRRQWAAAVLAALTLASLMTSANYTSLARNSLTLFPLTILVASTLLRPRWRWLYWIGLACSVTLLSVNTWLSTLGAWAD